MYGPFRYQLRWPWQCVPLDYPAPTFISNYRRNDSVSNDDLDSLSSTIALIFSPGGRRCMYRYTLYGQEWLPMAGRRPRRSSGYFGPLAPLMNMAILTGILLPDQHRDCKTTRHTSLPRKSWANSPHISQLSTPIGIPKSMNSTLHK